MFNVICYKIYYGKTRATPGKGSSISKSDMLWFLALFFVFIYAFESLTSDRAGKTNL